jgi:hypothetical protein
MRILIGEVVGFLAELIKGRQPKTASRACGKGEKGERAYQAWVAVR